MRTDGPRFFLLRETALPLLRPRETVPTCPACRGRLDSPISPLLLLVFSSCILSSSCLMGCLCPFFPFGNILPAAAIPACVHSQLPLFYRNLPDLSKPSCAPPVLTGYAATFSLRRRELGPYRPAPILIMPKIPANFPSRSSVPLFLSLRTDGQLPKQPP